MFALPFAILLCLLTLIWWVILYRCRNVCCSPCCRGTLPWRWRTTLRGSHVTHSFIRFTYSVMRMSGKCLCPTPSFSLSLCLRINLFACKVNKFSLMRVLRLCRCVCVFVRNSSNEFLCMSSNNCTLPTVTHTITLAHTHAYSHIYSRTFIHDIKHTFGSAPVGFFDCHHPFRSFPLSIFFQRFCCIKLRAELLKLLSAAVKGNLVLWPRISTLLQQLSSFQTQTVSGFVNLNIKFS